MKKKYLLVTVLFGAMVTSNIVRAICVDNILKSTPDDQFVFYNNGTLLDQKSGLIWMRCSLGQKWNGNDCIEKPLRLDWQSALAIAKDYVYADANNWRLPNIKELASILENACYSPAVNEYIFPSTLTDDDNGDVLYWASTPMYSDRLYFGMSAVIDFDEGGIGWMSRELRYFVRLVR